MQKKTRLAIINFIAVTILHVSAIYALFYVSWTWELVLLFLITYQIKITGISLGFHRYFTHKAFKTSRPVELALALMGTWAGQGPLRRWVLNHRDHHRFSDQIGDPHSPQMNGLFHAHVGWLFNPDNFDDEKFQDKPLTLSPEVQIVSKYFTTFFLLPLPLLYFWGGAQFILVGFCLSTVCSLQSTFLVNSICHRFGSRPYDTGDGSRNNWIAALVTNGEGWHNNHHHSSSSARLGFKKTQIDLGYFYLCCLQKLGWVWNVKNFPHRPK